MFFRSDNSMRPGFTLVELLVTITIIGILASLLLGVAAVAAETGREAKTKALITKLHTLLMEHYDTYRDKRVEIRSDFQQRPINENGGNLSGMREGTALAIGRVAGAREQMKMEMPDRWSDFLLTSLGTDEGDRDDPLPAPASLGTPLYLESVPSLAEIYRGVYLRIQARGDATAGTLADNQGAECLYMIITYATGDGEARGQFKETDIADTDGDGAPEFVDGWGRPIQFLRWAPGYSSDLQLSIPWLKDIGDDAQAGGGDFDEAVTTAITADHDPFDLFRQDRPMDPNNRFASNAVRGFRLTPLIYSGGRDEAEGIVDSNDTVLGAKWWNNSFSNPYFHPSDNYLGQPTSDEAVDNVTNHLITAN